MQEGLVGLGAIYHDKTDKEQSLAYLQEMRLKGSDHSNLPPKATKAQSRILFGWYEPQNDELMFYYLLLFSKAASHTLVYKKQRTS